MFNAGPLPPGRLIVAVLTSLRILNPCHPYKRLPITLAYLPFQPTTSRPSTSGHGALPTHVEYDESRARARGGRAMILRQSEVQRSEGLERWGMVGEREGDERTLGGSEKRADGEERRPPRGDGWMDGR
ncbi:hypothetical protein EX30DRAFT_193527 [Ascodesmis nigricans]|uniref:Uncharacterized protein n=1 Tax=Ascodesmis nigricans TaxID=341454 RepID=A0A4S2N0T7_9PEZI|nr:hypothetical protein EX30DRAFT_193527 [Ascodesmis nigricans]